MIRDVELGEGDRTDLHEGRWRGMFKWRTASEGHPYKERRSTTWEKPRGWP